MSTQSGPLAVLLFERDNDCPSGQQFYRCAANNFKGCCSVDACNEADGCPDDALSSALGGALTPPSTLTTKVASTSTPTFTTTTSRSRSNSAVSTSTGSTDTSASTSTPVVFINDPSATDSLASSASTTTTSSDSLTSSPSPSADSAVIGSHKDVPSKALVGGVAGGIVGFGLLLALIWYCLRYRGGLFAFFGERRGKTRRRSSFESGPEPELITSEKGKDCISNSSKAAGSAHDQVDTNSPPYNGAANNRNVSLSPVYEQQSPRASTFADSTIMSIPRSAPHSPQSTAGTQPDPSVIELPGSMNLPNEFPNTPAFSAFTELPTPDLRRPSAIVPSPLRIGNRHSGSGRVSPGRNSFQYGTSTPTGRASLSGHRVSMPASTAQLRQAHHVMSWASFDNEPVHEGSSPDMTTGLRGTGIDSVGLGLESTEFARLRAPHSSPDMGGSAWTQISKDQLKNL